MDISEDLRKYIKVQRSNGVDDELIKASIIKSGWTEEVANKALKPDAPISGAAPKAVSGVESKEVEPSSETTENIVEDKETPTKPKKKRWLVVSIILLVVALLSVGGWFGLQYFGSERVVVSSLKSLLDSDLSKYQLSLDFEAIPPTGEARAVAFSSYELSANASIDTENNTAGATLEIGDKTNSLGVLEVRRVNDTVYLRADILDESFLALGLQDYNQQWFSISLGGIIGSEGVGGGYQLSADDGQVDDIVAAYRGNPFITVVDELGVKEIAGEDAKGYQISYDRDELAGWLAEVEEITNQPDPIGIDQIKADIPEPRESEVLSIWISEKSNLPVGLEYDLTPTTDNTGYKARLTISSIGEPIEVVEPSPATPLDDVLGGFISSFDLATESLADSRKWLLSGYR